MFDRNDRRKFVITILWIIGFIVLVLGLFRLYNIFVQEKNSATYELTARKKTLEQYAAQAIQLYLQRELQQVESTASLLKNDPLIIKDDIFLMEKGVQRLPRQVSYLPTGDKVKELYDYIYFIDPLDLMGEKLSPWQERLTLLSHFKLAIDAEEASDIRWSFREIREHRTRNILEPEKDIPFMIALLDYFLYNSKPKHTLIARAIRGGTIIEQEHNIPGLQRMLLLHRDHFTKRDFDFLKNKIVSLSKTVNIPYKDFILASDRPEENVVLKIENVDSPVFIVTGRWYVEPREGNNHIGIQIDIAKVITSITNEMKQLGLLEGNDQLRHNINDNNTMPLSSIIVSVESLRWKSAEAAIEDHFILKRTLLFFCGFLVLAIVILATISYLLKQRYLKVKSDFIAAVSHELRTPLASIRLMSETLQIRLEGIDEAKDYPGRIINAVDSLSLLVNNILSYNRLNKGLWKPKNREFNIGELMGELRSEFKNYATVPLNISIKGLEKLNLSGDFELLKILFRNLISNAYKYNTHETVDIEISSNGTFGKVICFKDNGIGIQEKNWKKIFFEFQRYVEDKETNIEGTGLGLTLCKKIMQLHNGDIRVASSSEDGTKFELNFA